jgi:hypothetical protein
METLTEEIVDLVMRYLVQDAQPRRRKELA